MTTNNNEKMTSDEFTSLNLHYTTSELNFLQKFLQMYWMNPKSWLLEELTIKNGNIDVLLKNNTLFQAPLSELKVRHQKDNYDRIEFYLSYDKKKIHFKEISGMLTDEEWQEIKDILLSVNDSKVSTLGKVINIARKVLDSVKED